MPRSFDFVDIRRVDELDHFAGANLEELDEAGPPPVKCKRRLRLPTGAQQASDGDDIAEDDEAVIVEPLEPLSDGASLLAPFASPTPVIGRSVTGIGQPLRRGQHRLQQQQQRRRPAATRDMCADNWKLDEANRSHETVLLTPTAVLFHPRWSNGHAAVRGNRPLDRSLVHYWEVTFGDRVFGTAMQVGLCTGEAKLHADEFLENLIGRDEHGWGLSHKGLAWHNGASRRFCEPFAENQSCTVGVLFDGPRGTLSFYLNGTRLDAEFAGLERCSAPLYPVLSSTAAKTGMSVSRMLRSYESLQDRCCAALARSAATSATAPQWWRLPPPLRRLLADRFDVADC